MPNNSPKPSRASQAPEHDSPDNIMVDELPSSSRSPSIQPELSDPPGLQCLADGPANERPPYSNFTLVKYAILGSPNQRLTLSEIYVAIANRFPWFQTAGKGWKNSVRHCLSLDTQFRKEPRPPTEAGKGCYWTVSLDIPRGNKRARKRNKKPTRRQLAAELARIRNPAAAYQLTTPAFRDYDTTVPLKAPPNPVAQTPVQSGWTPYFPTTVMMSPLTPMSLTEHYAETSYCRETSTTPGSPSEHYAETSYCRETSTTPGSPSEHYAETSYCRATSTTPGSPSEHCAETSTTPGNPSASLYKLSSASSWERSEEWSDDGVDSEASQ